MGSVLFAPLAMLLRFEPRLYLFLIAESVVSNTVARRALELDEIVLGHTVKID